MKCILALLRGRTENNKNCYIPTTSNCEQKRRVSLINFESRSIFRLFENVSILENEIGKIQDKFKKKKSNVNELLQKT
jgi:hypothetical protein